MARIALDYFYAAESSDKMRQSTAGGGNTGEEGGEDSSFECASNATRNSADVQNFDCAHSEADDAAPPSTSHSDPPKMPARQLPSIGRLQRCLLHMVPALRQSAWERRAMSRDGSLAFLIGIAGCQSQILEKSQTFIDVNEVLLQVTKNFILIVSFGIVCPLLGLVLLCDVVSTCTRQQYLIKSFCEDGTECIGSSRRKSAEVEALNADCALAWQKRKNIIYRVRWTLLLFPSLFFALFVFDMIGDEMGWLNGVWAPLLMLVVPTLLFLLTTCLFPLTFARHAENISSGSYVSTVSLSLSALPSLGGVGRDVSQLLSMRVMVDDSGKFYMANASDESRGSSRDRGDPNPTPNPIISEWETVPPTRLRPSHTQLNLVQSRTAAVAATTTTSTAAATTLDTQSLDPIGISPRTPRLASLELTMDRIPPALPGRLWGAGSVEGPADELFSL